MIGKLEQLHSMNLVTIVRINFVIPVGGRNITTSSCDAIYGFIEQLLVDLDVTEYCCLTYNSTCTNNGTRTNYAKGTHIIVITF